MVMLVALAYSVIGVTSFDFRLPVPFTTVTSTTVNYSFVYNQTNNDATNFVGVIYNATSSSGPFTVLFSALNVTNGSTINTSGVQITMRDNDRHFWYINVTNGSESRGQVISSTRIVDVDTSFLTFQLGAFGKINFTVDTGAAAFAGNTTSGGHVIIGAGTEAGSRNLTLFDSTGSQFTCGINNTGDWSCQGV